MHQVQKCPKCMTKVIYTAEVCPNCGEILKKFAFEEKEDIPPVQPSKRKITIFLVPLVVVAALIFSLFIILIASRPSKPEDAVRKLFDAITARDADELLRMIEPGERTGDLRNAKNIINNRFLSQFNPPPESFEIIRGPEIVNEDTATVKVRFIFSASRTKMESDFRFKKINGSWMWMNHPLK